MIAIKMVRNGVGDSIRNILKAISPNNQKRLLVDVATEFQKMARSNFGQTGRYRGAQWAPLSTTYAKKVGSRTPTDIRSGALYRSIQISSPRSNYINVYSRSPYGAAIAYGNKSQNLPGRNFWPTELYGSPMRQRLTVTADRDLYSLISRRLNYYSSGQLAYGTIVRRSTIQVGNPFTLTR